jgi:apolipoprotein D and lipocalin family protein
MKSPWNPRIAVALSALMLLLGACATVHQPPIQPVAGVELPRFMGDWYVIAHIPTFIEKNACNAIERYDANADGTIATTFTFHEGRPDGPFKRYRPTGFVRDADHSTWGMQFLWPIKAEYLIAYLDPGYTETIIARNSRDYVWIMARTPKLGDDDYARLVERVAALGYDTSRLRRVPQEWPTAR